MEAFFRAGVAALLVNSDGLVLAGERLNIAGAWQVPQGGMLMDEDPLAAVQRELQEELEIDWSNVTILAEHDGWLAYELPASARNPKVGRGQVHRWFLLGYSGEGTPPPRQSEETEFARTRWTSINNLIDSSWAVRRPALETVLEEWRDHLTVTCPSL